METFQLTFRALVPLFLIIALGYICKRVDIVKEEEQPRMSALGFKVFLPMLLFYNIYQFDATKSVGGRLLIFCIVGVLVVYTLSVAAAFLFEKRAERRGAMVQALFRSNYILLGLPLVSALYPEALGMASIVGAIVIPMFNVLAVVTLESLNGQKVDIKHIVLGIMKNPLTISSTLGILCVLAGIKLPYVMEKAVADISRAATPFLLFSLGVFFRFRVRFDGTLVICLLGRLLLVPGAALLAAWLLGLRDGELVVVLTLFGSPQAVSAFPMAQQLGGDAELAGNCTVLGSALSFFSIFFFCCIIL